MYICLDHRYNYDEEQWRMDVHQLIHLVAQNGSDSRTPQASRYLQRRLAIGYCCRTANTKIVFSLLVKKERNLVLGL